MEQLIYVPIGLMVLFIGGLIAVNKEIVKRPTLIDSDDRYKKKEVCDEIHKSVDEKLECIPVIKDTLARVETKVDILLNNK